MSKPILCVMVGISGSGKSTMAEQRLESFKHLMPQQSIESSDKWRETLYNDVNDQTHNAEVFQAMQKSTVEKLKRGENVIYDATNIKIKDRKKILDLVKNINCHKTCAIVATPIEECIRRDANRERSVGERVIKRQLHNFQIPFYEEGWNDIVILNNGKSVTYDNLLQQMINFNQQNKYHDFDLLTHCNKTASNMLMRCIYDLDVDMCLLIGASIHDIGKLFVQTFTDDGQAHYFNHGNVGAYYVLANLNVSSLHIDMQEHEYKETILNICFYINYHMLPFDWKTEKAKDKWKKVFGEQKFNDLLLIHECDKETQHRKEE